MLPDTGWDARCGLTPADRLNAVRAARHAGLPEGTAWDDATLCALTADAALVAAYLDHRVRFPLVQDLAYYLLLLLELLDRDLAVRPGAGGTSRRLSYFCDPALPYATPTVVSATPADVESVLEDVAAHYLLPDDAPKRVRKPKRAPRPADVVAAAE